MYGRQRDKGISYDPNLDMKFLRIARGQIKTAQLSSGRESPRFQAICARAIELKLRRRRFDGVNTDGREIIA